MTRLLLVLALWATMCEALYSYSAQANYEFNICEYTPAELLDALHVYRHLVDWWPTVYETREIHSPNNEHSSHIIVGYWHEYCTDTTCVWREVMR